MQQGTQKAAGKRLYTTHFCRKFTNNTRDYKRKIQKKKKNSVNYVNNRGEERGKVKG